MTRDEAIKALGLMPHVESIVATYEPGEKRNDTSVRELKEACRMAVAALRAQQEPVKLDRSRWKGCDLCKGAKNIFGYGVTAFLGQSDDGESNLYRESDEEDTDFDFCPICGKPLTEEAWAELERRLSIG